jgi:hypothetical protein
MTATRSGAPGDAPARRLLARRLTQRLPIWTIGHKHMCCNRDEQNYISLTYVFLIDEFTITLNLYRLFVVAESTA